MSAVSPYEILADARAIRRDTKSTIMRIGDLLENLAFNFRDPGVVLIDVQHARYYDLDIENRYLRLAANNYPTMVIGEKIPVVAEPGFQTVPAPAGSAVARQWAVFVLNVDDAAAVAGWDCGDSGHDGQRRFDYVYTHDRNLVIAAARALTGHREPDTDTDPPSTTRHKMTPQNDNATVADHLLLARNRGPP